MARWPPERRTPRARAAPRRLRYRGGCRGEVEGLQEAPGALVPDYAQAFYFLSLRVEKDDPGRAEQREALEQCAIGFAVGGHVYLEQKHAVERGAHSRVAEGERLHLLARDAPVGIEIEHHRPPGRGEPAFQLAERRDAVPGQRGGRCRRLATELGKRAQRVAAARERADQQRDADDRGYDACSLPQPPPARHVRRKQDGRAQ